MADTKIKVLIVARPYDAEVMRRALAEASYGVTLADWGSNGCQQVESEQPAAVVLSTRRAEEECALFLRGLRAGEHGRAVPVLVIAEPGSRLATTELGADRLLLRPLDLSALVGAIRFLVGEPQAAAVEAVAPAPAPPRGNGDATTTRVLRGGRLLETDPARLIAAAHREGITGRLSFRRGEAEKSILFDAGEPVFAQSNQRYDRLGDLLFREGKITRQDYRLCDDGVAESGRRLGAILVDRGLIKARELFPLVRRQVGEIIYSVFSWTDGTYQISAGEASPEERIRLEVPTAVLVLEGIRRKYGLDRLYDLVGAPDTCLLALPAAAHVAEEAHLSGAERACLELMDGRRSLQELRTGSGLGELAIYQLAHAALVLGAATVRGAGEIRVVDSQESLPAAQLRERSIDLHRVEAKYAQVIEADYFSLLGVAPDATSHEVLRAYQRACQEFSPEAFPAELREELQGKLDEIAEVLEEAYRVLGDQELRRSYRESIA